MNWLKAILPEPRVVSGVILHPFTFGHWLLIARVTGWEFGKFPPEIAVFTLWTCSRPWREAWRNFATPGALKWCGRVARRATIAECTGLVDDIRAYLSDAMRCPGFVSAHKPATGSRMAAQRTGVPLMVQLRLFGLSILNLDDDTLCDMPASDLLSLWIAHLDNQGAIHVKTVEEETFTEWCNQQDAARMVAASTN